MVGQKRPRTGEENHAKKKMVVMNGIATVMGTKIPYICRNRKMYVAVRHVDHLLSRLSIKYRQLIAQQSPIPIFHVIPSEIVFFNQLDQSLVPLDCARHFTKRDTILKLSDFHKFLQKLHGQLVKQEQARRMSSQVTGGWIQIDNTVSPYIRRNFMKYVPLSIVRFAAGLLEGLHVSGEELVKEECDFLCKSCEQSQLNFHFPPSTKVISLRQLSDLTGGKIHLRELPAKNPFHYALEVETLHSPGTSTGGIYSSVTDPYSTNHQVPSAMDNSINYIMEKTSSKGRVNTVYPSISKITPVHPPTPPKLKRSFKKIKIPKEHGSYETDRISPVSSCSDSKCSTSPNNLSTCNNELPTTVDHLEKIVMEETTSTVNANQPLTKTTPESFPTSPKIKRSSLKVPVFMDHEPHETDGISSLSSCSFSDSSTSPNNSSTCNNEVLTIIDHSGDLIIDETACTVNVNSITKITPGNFPTPPKIKGSSLKVPIVIEHESYETESLSSISSTSNNGSPDILPNSLIDTRDDRITHNVDSDVRVTAPSSPLQHSPSTTTKVQMERHTNGLITGVSSPKTSNETSRQLIPTTQVKTSSQISSTTNVIIIPDDLPEKQNISENSMQEKAGIRTTPPLTPNDGQVPITTINHNKTKNNYTCSTLVSANESAPSKDNVVAAPTITQITRDTTKKQVNTFSLKDKNTPLVPESSDTSGNEGFAFQTPSSATRVTSTSSETVSGTVLNGKLGIQKNAMTFIPNNFVYLEPISYTTPDGVHTQLSKDMSFQMRSTSIVPAGISQIDIPNNEQLCQINPNMLYQLPSTTQPSQAAMSSDTLCTTSPSNVDTAGPITTNKVQMIPQSATPLYTNIIPVRNIQLPVSNLLTEPHNQTSPVNVSNKEARLSWTTIMPKTTIFQIEKMNDYSSPIITTQNCSSKSTPPPDSEAQQPSLGPFPAQNTPRKKSTPPEIAGPQCPRLSVTKRKATSPKQRNYSEETEPGVQYKNPEQNMGKAIHTIHEHPTPGQAMLISNQEGKTLPVGQNIIDCQLSQTKNAPFETTHLMSSTRGQDKPANQSSTQTIINFNKGSFVRPSATSILSQLSNSNCSQENIQTVMANQVSFEHQEKRQTTILGYQECLGPQPPVPQLPQLPASQPRQIPQQPELNNENEVEVMKQELADPQLLQQTNDIANQQEEIPCTTSFSEWQTPKTEAPVNKRKRSNDQGKTKKVQ